MTTAVEKGVTTQVYRVFIKATPQAIWDAMARPEWLEKYGYACRADFDLRPGGAYRTYANAAMKAQGTPEVIIVGEVLESSRHASWCKRGIRCGIRRRPRKPPRA